MRLPFGTPAPHKWWSCRCHWVGVLFGEIPVRTRSCSATVLFGHGPVRPRSCSATVLFGGTCSAVHVRRYMFDGTCSAVHVRRYMFGRTWSRWYLFPGIPALSSSVQSSAVQISSPQAVRSQCQTHRVPVQSSAVQTIQCTTTSPVQSPSRPVQTIQSTGSPFPVPDP